MLPSLVLPSTLLFFLWAPVVFAGDVPLGQACDPARQKLQEGTFQFQTDCDAMTYCDPSTSKCAAKRCRVDTFPFGYTAGVTIPDKCPKHQFCPDEQDACQDLLPVGSPCQFNRDDQCEGPPDFKDLADHTGLGLNVNGSVCLNNICMWANGTAGTKCVVQNTAYTAYGPDGEFLDIVSRGNCKVGLYCDSQSLQCIQSKELGATCDADKECLSYNCLSNGTCGKSTDTPVKVATWVYIVVAIAILGGMVGTLVALYFVHRKDRQQEREKRAQYWREQNAFRQNIMQMQESARHSLMSYTPGGGSPRSSTYHGIQTEDSQAPMLNGQGKSSGLRYYVSDDASQVDDRSEEDLMMRRRPEQNRF